MKKMDQANEARIAGNGYGALQHLDSVIIYMAPEDQPKKIVESIQLAIATYRETLSMTTREKDVKELSETIRTWQRDLQAVLWKEGYYTGVKFGMSYPAGDRTSG